MSLLKPPEPTRIGYDIRIELDDLGPETPVIDASALYRRVDMWLGDLRSPFQNIETRDLELTVTCRDPKPAPRVYDIRDLAWVASFVADIYNLNKLMRHVDGMPMRVHALQLDPLTWLWSNDSRNKRNEMSNAWIESPNDKILEWLNDRTWRPFSETLYAGQQPS